MTHRHVGIAGCGVTGLLMAKRLRDTGWDATLIDADAPESTQSCTYTGAGMLAPYCELEHSTPQIAALGHDSAKRWEDLLCGLNTPVLLERKGSLAVAHADDQADLGQLQRSVTRHFSDKNIMEEVDRQRIEELEPAISDRFSRGLFFPAEGHINNRELLVALRQDLQIDPRVNFVHGMKISSTEPGRITMTNDISYPFDLVVDCRGLGAREQLKDLRGVRGELIYVRSREVELRRPVRLMHPRYPLYIVPRANQVFVIGATQIESDHPGPMTLRSALEILSAAYALHTGFAEAEILEMRSACRPAFSDNLPRIMVQDGLIHVNGLFRHGFLLSPVLTEMAAQIIGGKHLQEFPDSIVTSTS